MLNNYCLVELIDNVKTGNITDLVVVKGYSHLTNILYPNCGKVVDSDKLKINSVVYFKDFGAIKFGDNKVAIKHQDIFFVDNQLVAPGIVVKRQKVDQIDNGFHYRSQDWFYVVKSNDALVPEGSIIVAKPETSFKFNYNKNKYYYIDPENVLLVFNNGINAGANYVLDKALVYGVFDDKKEMRSERFYFSLHYGFIVYDGIKYNIIDKQSIYALSV